MDHVPSSLLSELGAIVSMHADAYHLNALYVFMQDDVSVVVVHSPDYTPYLVKIEDSEW